MSRARSGLVLLLACVGLALSAYAFDHWQNVRVNGVTDALCNISERLSCDTLARSRHALLFGVPMPVLGLAYFMALAGGAAAGLLTVKRRAVWGAALALFAAPTALFAVWALGLAFFAVGVICLTCVAVHVTAMAAVAVLIAGLPPSRVAAVRAAWPEVLRPLAVLAAVTASAVGAWRLAAPGIDRAYAARSDIGAENAAYSWESMVDLRERAVFTTRFAGDFATQDRYLGAPGADVELVVFVDYECPVCADFFPTITRLLNAFKGHMVVVFKNFPLSSQCNAALQEPYHKYACGLAQAAQCLPPAADFRGFAGHFYGDAQSEDGDVLTRWLATSPDATAIRACIQRDDVQAKIKDDVAWGIAHAFRGTPQVYINGYHYVGVRRFGLLKKAIVGVLTRED